MVTSNDKLSTKTIRFLTTCETCLHSESMATNEETTEEDASNTTLKSVKTRQLTNVADNKKG